MLCKFGTPNFFFKGHFTISYVCVQLELELPPLKLCFPSPAHLVQHRPPLLVDGYVSNLKINF